MHVVVHVGTAVVVGLSIGHEAAIGCVLPDVAWASNELALCRAGGFAAYMRTCSERDLVLYRLTHSLLFVALCALVHPGLALGVLVHVLMDAPVHYGRLCWMPVYPWRWPWQV